MSAKLKVLSNGTNETARMNPTTRDMMKSHVKNFGYSSTNPCMKSNLIKSLNILRNEVISLHSLCYY